jgi:hypothetical protein
MLERSDLDCFLSQFVSKHPDALGQPWHRDAHYQEAPGERPAPQEG